MGRYDKKTNCSRVLFFLLNCFFWVASLGLFAVGVWLLYVGQESDYDVITGSRNVVSGAALLIFAGGVSIIVSAVGMAAAYAMRAPLLITYIVLVLLIAAAEIAAGILGFLFRKQINDTLEERLINAISDYRLPGQEGYNEREGVNNAINYVQEQFECCGVNGSLDWLDINPAVFVTAGNKPPNECLCYNSTDTNCQLFNFTYTPEDSFTQQTVEYYAWERGCLNHLKDEFRTIAITVGAAGIGVGTIEVAGVVLALCLCVCSMKTKSDTPV